MKLNKSFAAILGIALSASALAVGACTPQQEPPQDLSVYSVKLPQERVYLLPNSETESRFELKPVVKIDKVAAEDARCTYSVDRPNVASVDENGIITALSYGSATVTATYTAESGKSASDTVTVMVFGEATAEEVNSFDEQFVNLYGRMDNGEGVVNIDNVGSGIEIAFYGTELKAKLTVTQPSNGMKIFGHVFIDGEMGEFTPFVSGDEVVLAQDLEEGIHTAALHKSSEIDEGRIAVNEFYAERFLRIPEKSSFKMEFIGDSITCGYGNMILGAGANRNSDNSDACLSYAFLTGKALGADFSIVSYSGICVKADRWGAGFAMVDLHTYTSLQTKTPYTYDADMDVVVLNLGTNDASYNNEIDHTYFRQFPNDYRDFLTHLRTVYPDAYIVCAYGMMGLDDHIDSGIKQAIEEMNDKKISYKTFLKNDAGVGGHPYRTAHKMYAEQLTEYIESLLAE